MPKYFTNREWVEWNDDLMWGLRDGLAFVERQVETGEIDANWEEASAEAARKRREDHPDGFAVPKHLLTYQTGFYAGVLSLWRHLYEQEQQEVAQPNTPPKTGKIPPPRQLKLI